MVGIMCDVRGESAEPRERVGLLVVPLSTLHQVLRACPCHQNDSSSPYGSGDRLLGQMYVFV